jgi:hypothetical protein
MQGPVISSPRCLVAPESNEGGRPAKEGFREFFAVATGYAGQALGGKNGISTFGPDFRKDQ